MRINTISRRTRVVAAFAAGTLAITLAGCSGGGESDSGGDGDRVSVVVTALHSAALYYQEEMQGAKDFGAEDGNVDLTVTAPPSYDAEAAQKQVRDLLATAPDAMGVTPQPPDLWGRTMQDLVDQLDGKVIAYSERPTSTEEAASDAVITTTVGYADLSASRDLIEKTIEVAGLPESSTGKVLLGPCTPDETGTVALRLNGFIEGVKAKLPNAEIVTVVTAPGVKENQDRWASALSANPDAILAAGTCEPDGQSLYRLKKERGYDFALGAMELTDESIAGLEDGTTTAVQSANTWLMGYTTARMLTMSARGEELPVGFISTGGSLFTAENVADTQLRADDPAAFYQPLVDELFADGMPKAAPISDAWN